MPIKANIWLSLWMFSCISFSQGIQDSVFVLPQVKITADKLFRKERAGMRETHIDTLALQSKTNLSLSDLLSENSSVFIRSHGRGALATASFRGTSASHTQVRWNGLNINSPMAGMVDFSLIPVYLIDDVSLKHGTASIADQSGGLGGSINITNHVDWEQKVNLRYIQGVGSYNTYDELVQFGGGNQHVQFKTRIYHNQSANDYTFINRGIGDMDPLTGKLVNPQDTNKNAAYMKYGILQEAYFRMASNHIVSARYWGQAANRSIPKVTSYEGSDYANLNKQEDTDHRFVAEWKHSKKKSHISARTGYSNKQVTYTLNNHVPGLGLIPAIHSESQQQSFLNTLQHNYTLTENLSAESTLDANYQDITSQDSVQQTGYARQRFEASYLFSLHQSIANRLNLKVMFRQDWMESQLAPLIPFLGFDFRILKGKDLILKGNIARNYHHPSLNDLYWQPGGNPDLLPEEGMSSEAGLAYKGQVKGHQISLEGTAYRSDINQWIIWLPSYKGYWEPRNIERVLSRGMEFHLQLHGQWRSFAYKTSGTYAYTHSVNYGNPYTWGDESYGKQLAYIPLHSGNVLFNLAYQGFFITFQHNSYSKRFTTSSNETTSRNWLYPYFMNDLQVGRKMTLGKVSCSTEFKIYNLFNESYHSVLYRPMPGRNYMVMLMFKL